MQTVDIAERIKAIPLWQSDIDITPLEGGITNVNYLVSHAAGKHVVRVGDDIPHHHVMRFNELAASYAAYDAGLSPAVRYSGDGMTVLDYIDSITLTPELIRSPEYFEPIAELVARCHRDLGKYLKGPALSFWVFHVIRDYAHTLRAGHSNHVALLPELLALNDKLEQSAGPFELNFCHNDLLAGNFLDDGDRLWLIDWDYAGFNSPLFDLGGLASNNELSEKQEHRLLEIYYDSQPSAQRLKQYYAMKCASLLRETMWSMVSEVYSTIDFDYAAYSAENLLRFKSAIANFNQM